MNYKTIVITGSNGSTAKGLIRYFSNHFNNVIGISRDPHESFTQNNVYIYKANMLNRSESFNISKHIIEKHQAIGIRKYCS